MKIINARLRGRSGLFTIDIDVGTISGIGLQPSPLPPQGTTSSMRAAISSSRRWSSRISTSMRR